MRLKTTPADFRVRELLDFHEDPRGEHYVHLLHKEKLSTTEALGIVVRDADVDRGTIAYAGLKDRQAITEQYVSIAGRAIELDRPGLRIKPIGRSAEPITSRMSRGNAFTITVRDLGPAEAAMLRRNLPSLQKTGFPNYFDDQRFGCLRHGQGFPMLPILRGDFERALQQLVATPSPRAITGDVKLKEALQRHWGDWETCARFARGPVYEPMFGHLHAHPDDFRGAIEFLPLRQRVIHAFAYQSLLWNRAVSRLLRGGVGSAQRLRIATLAGDLLAWKYLEPEKEQKLLAMETPMYGPEGSGGSEPFRKAMAAELEYSGLQRSDFLENSVPGMVWREEPRQVLIKPLDLTDVRIAPDEMHDGRVMATIGFALPRGAYATMLLKRLFAPAWYADSGDGGDDRGRGRGYGRGGGRGRGRPGHGRPYRGGGGGDDRGPRSPAPWQRDDEDQSE